MFPRIQRAVAAILADGKVVVPVAVLVKMGMLAPRDLENWPFHSPLETSDAGA
jgi:hypothetical protein